MSKRKERSLVELYKRAVKLSRPRVTPILEGNCRMQGPLDEFGSESETDMACSTEGRTVEERLVATVDCSISTNAALQCNNEIQKCTVDLPNSTCDEQLTGMRVTRRESSDDHCIGKPSTRNTVEREETSGSVKTRVNRNTRRARGSKIRKTDRVRNHADYRQDVEERKSASVIEGNEELFEGPGISQSNFKEGIPSAGKQSEESHEKYSTDKLFDVLKSVGSPHNGDIDVCCHEENMEEQVGAERELPSIEPIDVNNMDCRDSDSVETLSNKKNLDTCNMALISADNEITKEKIGSKDLPGLKASVSFQSFNGFDADLHLPASESAGMSGIHFNGDLCNAEDVKENPTKLENTDNQAATHTESHAETNILLAEGTRGFPSKVDTENVTATALPGKIHSGKVAFGKIEDSVDVIGKVQVACIKGKFLLQNNNIEARTSANANVATADGYCNHSSPGNSLCLAGVEHADMAVEYGPLDHSSSSSLHKAEPPKISTAEESISQEVFSSSPLTITPGHSSVTSHASQSNPTAKEIEAHSSCHQEDFILTCSPEPAEISSTKNPICDVEEAKDVALVLPEVLPKGPDYQRDECVKSNFSAGFLAISSVPGEYSESGNNIKQVPVEVGPDFQLEPGDQVKTVAKEDTPHDAEIKLEEDFHIDKGNIKVGPSEIVGCSEGSLLCQSFLKKSSEPPSAEDDVKVCDICGDTGYEEMLAVCSMCNDGAEHTYCMPSMLDEVPESDWLCEVCKLQQSASVKRVETSPNLRMVLKPACLTSRKHNYGTSRSRLSAKLDKMKLGPDRQRAIKGTLSSQVSTKRQAEGFEVEPPMKKLALQASNGHSGSLTSNAKPIFSRENSLKALNIIKVKTSITASPTGNSLSNILHDSDNSSTLLRTSSPRPSTNMQSSKNKFVSTNGLATDHSALTGTSKAGSNVSSTGLATLTGKSSADRTFPSLPPARLSNLEKLSASPKIINDSGEPGFQAKAARENMSNICAVGGFSKSSKSTINANLSALSESMLTSDIQNVKIKEMRTGKVRKDGSDLSRSKSIAMPLCIPRDPVSAGVTNIENLATVGTCVKPVTCAIKDSSKSIWSEEKTAVAPTQVLPNSNKKEHSSIRSSGEGQAQLKASSSRLKEGTPTNKLQQSASIETVHNVASKKLKGLSHIDATYVVKPMAEGNNLASSIEDSKKNSCTKVVPEVYPSEHGKKCGSLHSKTIPNNNLVRETKKSGNSENFSSFKLSSRNHPSAVGTTRCYKCKQLGHSAQSCTNHSPAETGSNRLPASTLISPSMRSSKEISDAGSRKLSLPEQTAFPIPGNITGCQNSQSSGKKQLNFDSDVRDHVQWLGSSSPGQVSGNQEMSCVELKSNSTLPSKGTTDFNEKLDVKNSENREISPSNVDLAGCSITAPQILASRPSKSPLSNHSSATATINGESISRACFNERKRTEWAATNQKFLYQRRLEEGEGRFLTRDSSHIATTAITQPAVHPAEGTVVAIGGITSCGLPSASDASDQPHTDSRVVPRQQSSHPETVKPTILPEHNFLWQGGFEVRNKANSFNYFDGIQAHASTCAVSKVLDAVKKFPSKLQLEEVPRCSSWPLQFQYSHPSDENIALYFFAKDHESYGKSYRLLLEHILKNDFALRGNFDGVELLVFPSNQLPEKSQRWNRLLYLWGVFRGRNSSCSEPSTSAFAEGMDAEKDGGGESCAPVRALRASGNQLSPSVSDQGEKPNGSCFNIPNPSSVKDGKVYNAQKNDGNAAGRLLVLEKNLMRFTDLDLPPGFETIAAKKPHDTKDDITCQSKSIQEDGSGKTVESGTNEEVSSSHRTSETKKIDIKSGYTPGPSDISSSPTEKLTCSCVTSGIAFCDSPGQCSEIDKGKSRVRDAENVRKIEIIKEMEFARLRPKDGDMDQESRLDEKESENSAIVIKGERERSLSSSKQEDYSNHESNHYRDGRHEMYHPCLPHTCSSPRDGIQSHSPKLQVCEGEIPGRQSREEQDQSVRLSAEPKMVGVPTYQIADLNRVPDYDSALEFSGTPVQHHIQPIYPDYHPSVPHDSKLTGTMLFPGPEDIRVNCRLSKLSEEWTTGLGSIQNSSGPSSSGQFVATTEENIQERPDLNIPILELSLGGKKSSSNPVILPLSANLLPNSPIKSSLTEGIERGSSLSLSLAFPLSQKDQTAKTLKEDQPNPANCSVNTSICLFGRRVDC